MVTKNEILEKITRMLYIEIDGKRVILGKTGVVKELKKEK